MHGSEGTHSVNQQLQRTIGFTAADLEANRAGRLGAGQRVRLLISLALLATLIAVLVTFVAVAWVRLGERQLPLLLLLSAAGLIFSGLFGWMLVKTGADLLNGQVERLEARVTPNQRINGRHSVYYYEAEGRQFVVSYTAHAALVSGALYRLYYTPHDHALIAAEYLHD